MGNNNSQQFQAQFSLNGQQVKDELKRIEQGVKDIDKAMQSMHNDGTEGYKRQMKELTERRNALMQEKREMNAMGKVLKDLLVDLDKKSPNQLRQTMRDINKAIDSGAIKRGTKDWQEAMRVLAKCDQELKKINAEINAAGQGGGFFGKLFGGLGGGGLGGGITAMLTKVTGFIGGAVTGFIAYKKVLSDIYTLNKDFEKQTAELAAVLGTTRDRIPSLIEQAKLLGETTMFTASEVAGLQINLAKLGFGTEEIKNSTAAILDFAAATGAELPEAARVAGAALRAFGADSTEMERYVSAMAVATTNSALDFEKLRTSVGIAFPAAKAFGFTIEDTTALLGKLSDSGYEASTAATALRNIFITMSDSNSKFVQAMGGNVETLDDFVEGLQRLETQEVSIGQLSAMVGKRAAAPLKVLVDNASGVKELRDRLTDCGEAMKAMVGERMNTLWGSTQILKSAWQGLILQFGEGNDVIRKVNEWLIKVIGKISELWKKTKTFFTDFYTESKAFRLVIQGVSLNFKIAFDVIVGAINGVVIGLKGMAKTLKAIMEGDFSGAWDALSGGFLEGWENFKNTWSNVGNDYKKAFDEVWNYKPSGKGPGEFIKEGVKNTTLTDEERAKLLAEIKETVDIATANIEQLQKRLKELREAQKTAMGDELQRINSEILQVTERLKAMKERATTSIKDYIMAREVEARAAIALLDEEALGEQEYARQVHEIKMQMLADQRDYFKQGSKDYNRYMIAHMKEEASWSEKQFAQNKKNREKMEKDQLNQALKNITQLKKLEDSMAKNQAEQMKANGIAELEADQWLNDELYKNRLKAIQARASLYAIDSDEYERAMQEMEQASEEHEQKVAETTAKARAKALQLVTQTENRANEWQKFQNTLDMLDKYHEMGILSEEEYSAAVDAVQQLRYKKGVEYAEKAANEISSLLSAAANFASSKYEAEIAQVEKRYDAEIEAAKKAGKDTTKLEKKKEKEVNALKLKEAEMQHDINIAQVLTDTALSIAKGYADYGPILGSVMAAVATAMGALQIATINQQFEAQKTSLSGYYDGGYTGYSGNYRQVAGVTHEGEFVANHKTVNNPEIRPMLDMLDYAQKHNSEAQLTQKDLAMADAYRQGGYYVGGYTSAPNVTVNPNVTVQRDDNYGRLTRILESIERDGIEAKAYPEGRFGWSTAMKIRNKIINNKSRI